MLIIAQWTRWATIPVQATSQQNIAMIEFDERSAYPLPNDFEVTRPEYEEQEHGSVRAIITVSPFEVTGVSAWPPGARRAALHQAHKTYRSYHPSYEVPSPFPDEFTDQEGVEWKRVPGSDYTAEGDYVFMQDEEEDYADIDQMLMWDVRPASSAE